MHISVKYVNRRGNSLSATLFVVDAFGICVKGAVRLKALDIFIPLAMSLDVKHA